MVKEPRCNAIFSLYVEGRSFSALYKIPQGVILVFFV